MFRGLIVIGFMCEFSGEHKMFRVERGKMSQTRITAVFFLRQMDLSYSLLQDAFQIW